MNTHRFRKLLACAVASVALFAAGWRTTASAYGQGPTDLQIYSADGTEIIGHGHYEMHMVDGSYLVRGENHYSSGQWDLEVARLQPADSPRQLSFRHSFFNQDGATRLIAEADFESGRASCVTNSQSKSVVRNAVLDFFPDTYSGASLLIPIQSRLRQGESDFKLHAFSCAPDPRVLSIRVRIRKETDPLPLHAAGLTEVEVKPDFGWLNLLAAPFVTRLHAWFDSGAGWSYAGASIDRFYRGPRILMVRGTDGQKSDRDAALDSSPHWPAVR